LLFADLHTVIEQFDAKGKETRLLAILC